MCQLNVGRPILSSVEAEPRVDSLTSVPLVITASVVYGAQHIHDLPLAVTNVLHSLCLFVSVKNFHQNKRRSTSLRFCGFYCKDKSRKGLNVTLWFHILKSMGDVEKQTEFIVRFMQESFLQSDVKKLRC